MNYRHAYHAGNFADVAKHLAIVVILLRLRVKETPFVVVDSHAGRGLYNLDGEEARRTGEAETGIGRLRGLSNGPAALSTYLDLVRGTGPGLYPGSPLFAAKLLRPQDRLVAIEKHPEDAAALAAALGPFRNARSEIGDGYARLPALLPPPERRGFVLIDPPYETESEFEDAARAFASAYHRFATGTYAIWFPVKSSAEADSLCGEVLAAGVRRAIRLDVALKAPQEDRLASAGLLIVNPPYRFEEDFRAAFAPASALSGTDARLERLMGD